MLFGSLRNGMAVGAGLIDPVSDYIMTVGTMAGLEYFALPDTWEGLRFSHHPLLTQVARFALLG